MFRLRPRSYLEFQYQDVQGAGDAHIGKFDLQISLVVVELLDLGRTSLIFPFLTNVAALSFSHLSIVVVFRSNALK